MAHLVKGQNKSRLTRSMVRAAKTNEKRLHVLPSKGKWGIKMEGADRMYRVYGSKASALKMARQRAHSHGNSMIIVHNKDGRIASISSYE